MQSLSLSFLIILHHGSSLGFTRVPAKTPSQSRGALSLGLAALCGQNSRNLGVFLHIQAELCSAENHAGLKLIELCFVEGANLGLVYALE